MRRGNQNVDQTGAKRGPKPGAPTKRSPEVEQLILDVLSAGGTWVMAAAAAGISDDTLVRWRDADPEFHTRCTRARIGCAADLAVKIRSEARSDWRAASWLIERLAPEQYGRRTIVTGDPTGVPIKIDAALSAAAEIRSNPESLSKLHDLIAAAVASDRDA